MRIAIVALALLATPVSADWVASEGCHTPDTNHSPDIINLTSKMGRWVGVDLTGSGVPQDAVYVELSGETRLSRGSRVGSCSVTVSVAGPAQEPGAHPYTVLDPLDVEKRQQWTLRGLPRRSLLSVRAVRQIDRPDAQCDVQITATVSRWCR